LNEQLTVEQLPELAAGLNRALVAQLPRRVWKKKRVVAIDMHDRCYYGKVEQAEGLWIRCRAKNGTTRFYRIATSYLVVDNLRFTLGICFYTPEDQPVAVVQQLWELLEPLLLPLDYLLLDKGFCGVDVQRFLTDQTIPAIIACTIRGKNGGTRALCRGRKSYRTTYTFSANSSQAHTAQLAVCRVFTSAKRTKRLKRRAMWQIFILIHLDLSCKKVRQIYRRRFGIETSYRCAGHLQAWTTSPNPTLRFLLMALPFLLINLWLRLRWLLAQIPRRGGRLIDQTLFTLERLVRFIRHALESHYGFLRYISALSIPIL
jgi:putative transposase